MNIIEQLKQNEKSFGLMSDAMQEKANEIGKSQFEYYYGDQKWCRCTDGAFFESSAYRLRADYEEEPEIVECKIYQANLGNCCVDVYDLGNYVRNGISRTPKGYKRIGFKFEDGTVFGNPIKYDVPGITTQGYFAGLNEIKSGLAKEKHATHIVFRRQK